MSPDVCVFCAASGCLDGTVEHGQECPFTTDMWPVDEWMISHDIECMACKERFAPGDTYASVRADTYPATGFVNSIVAEWGSVGDTGDVALTVCLPCAALGRPVES